MARKDAKTGKTQRPWQGRRDALGPRALAGTIARLTKPIFGKRGFAAGEIVSEWPRIAGPDIAAITLPERIAFPPGKRTGGTLHLRVAPGGHAITVQHTAPQLIERINTYFGYGAVRDVRIIQAPLPPRPPGHPASPPPSAPLSGPRPDAETPSTAEDPLEAALETLGRRVHDKNS